MSPIASESSSAPRTPRRLLRRPGPTTRLALAAALATGLAAIAHVLGARLAGDRAVALVAAAAIGGAALVCIVLVEVDRRLRRIEARQLIHHQTTERILNRGFSRFGGITRAFSEIDRSVIDTGTVEALMRAAARVPAETPVLAIGLAHAGVRRVTRLLDGLSGPEIVAETESADWLLGLTARAATSLRIASSAEATRYDPDLLNRCGGAVIKGLSVTWAIIGDPDATLDTSATIEALRDLGVDIRIVDPATATAHWSATDRMVVIVDDEIVHRTDADAPARLVLDADRISADVARVTAITDDAKPL